jgi:hypothetical protein
MLADNPAQDLAVGLLHLLVGTLRGALTLHGPLQLALVGAGGQRVAAVLRRDDEGKRAIGKGLAHLVGEISVLGAGTVPTSGQEAEG